MLQKHYTTFHTKRKIPLSSNFELLDQARRSGFGVFWLPAGWTAGYSNSPCIFLIERNRGSILPLQLSVYISHTIMFELTQHHTHHLGSRKFRWEMRRERDLFGYDLELWRIVGLEYDERTTLCFIWRKRKRNYALANDREQWLRVDRISNFPFFNFLQLSCESENREKDMLHFQRIGSQSRELGMEEIKRRVFFFVLCAYSIFCLLVLVLLWFVFHLGRNWTELNELRESTSGRHT